MSDKPDTLNSERPPQLTPDHLIHQEEVRAALLRLRELGEQLPAVDAAAIVREGRDLSAQDKR